MAIVGIVFAWEETSGLLIPTYPANALFPFL